LAKVWEMYLSKKTLVDKILRIKTIMGAIEKFDEFLKTLDEKYFLSIKEHFTERLDVKTNEKGELTSLNSGELNDLFTIEFITEFFAEIPDGFTEFLNLVDQFIEPISEMMLYFLSEYFVKQFDSSFLEELKYELDIGSDEALLALANNVFAKLGKEGLSHSKEDLQILNNVLININGNILKLLMQSILSIHLKQFGSAKMQIQHALKMLLNKLTPYNIQHAVVEKSTVKRKAKLAGKKGSDERWKLERKLKDKALVMLSDMKKSGKFQNSSQASKKLTESLCDYAKKLGCPFADPFSAQRRIYEWFRTGQK
jgi:hypothetical protein